MREKREKERVKTKGKTKRQESRRKKRTAGIKDNRQVMVKTTNSKAE